MLAVVVELARADTTLDTVPTTIAAQTMTAPDRPILLKRGVYKAPFKVEGCPALIVIDSKGERRRTVALRPGMDAVELTADLRDWLDDADPVLKLS
jgi:hypothetical protein